MGLPYGLGSLAGQVIMGGKMELPLGLPAGQIIMGLISQRGIIE